MDTDSAKLCPWRKRSYTKTLHKCLKVTFCATKYVVEHHYSMVLGKLDLLWYSHQFEWMITRSMTTHRCRIKMPTYHLPTFIIMQVGTQERSTYVFKMSVFVSVNLHYFSQVIINHHLKTLLMRLQNTKGISFIAQLSDVNLMLKQHQTGKGIWSDILCYITILKSL